jgi:PPOX class probable F420-dependent enzyme
MPTTRRAAISVVLAWFVPDLVIGYLRSVLKALAWRAPASEDCAPALGLNSPTQRWHVIELSANMKQFVAEVMPAVVGTRRQDGTVQMNPIWYEYRDGYFWLNSWRTSDWMRHVERDRDVTLHLMDPQDVGRWAQVQGKLVETSGEKGAEHIDALSMRYTGRPYDYRYNPRPRVRIKIEPVRITGSIDH